MYGIRSVKQSNSSIRKAFGRGFRLPASPVRLMVKMELELLADLLFALVVRIRNSFFSFLEKN